MDFTPEQKNSLRVVIQEVVGGVATKDDFLSIKEDLKGFATKEDLLGIKEDLKEFATKEDLLVLRQDLKGFATKDELEQVEDRLATTIAATIEGLETRSNKRFEAIDRRFERLENILNTWSPPSYIVELMDRVSKIEKYLKFKPHHR